MEEVSAATATEDAANTSGEVAGKTGPGAATPRKSTSQTPILPKSNSTVGAAKSNGTVVEDVAEGETPEADEVEIVESKEEAYRRIVSEKMMQSKGWRAEMANMSGGSLPEHIASVFQAAGGLDPVQRSDDVEYACKRQNEIQQAKRQRKKERMHDAVRVANKHSDEPGSRSKILDPAAGNQETSLLRAVADAMDAHDLTWTEVQPFKTKNEAVGFIMECQPFSYAPLGEVSFPKFDSGHESVDYVLKMTPVPMNFVSTVADFKRHLRIRCVEVGEEDLAKSKASARRNKRGGAAGGGGPPVAALAPSKPWVVEASGTFFESPTSLRSVKDGGKYFIAVAEEFAQRVQQEGYKSHKRFSIPCSASPHEAVMAWSKNELRCNRKKPDGSIATGVALAVVIPPEIDVVTHRKHGFLIRCKELPPSCFRIKKLAPVSAPGADT